MTSRVLFRHKECFIYRVPPESFSSSGHRAETWGLEKPFITGSVEVLEEPVDGTDMCVIKMFKGKKLFAKCEMNMELAQGKGRSFYLQDVVDSSRYWVLRIADKKSGRTAFIGFGFRERDTATELRTAVQDSLRFLDRQREAMRRQQAVNEDLAKAANGEDKSADLPESNLRLADGETLTIKVATGPQSNKKKPRVKVKTQGGDALKFFPAPPSASKPSRANKSSNQAPGTTKSDEPDQDEDWNDFTHAAKNDCAVTAKGEHTDEQLGASTAAQCKSTEDVQQHPIVVETPEGGNVAEF